jgi:hypothetical protein
LTIGNQNAGKFCLQINYFSELSDLLNIHPGKMGEALDTEYPRIALVLESRYGRLLKLQELEHRAQVISFQMNTPVPVGRTRETYLAWFDKHTPRSMQLWVDHSGVSFQIGDFPHCVEARDRFARSNDLPSGRNSLFLRRDILVNDIEALRDRPGISLEFHESIAPSYRKSNPWTDITVCIPPGSSGTKQFYL